MPLSINQIPIPVPSSTDPANFSARGDAVFGAFPNFITQTNAVASEAAANRDSAEASKVAAAISETNAATYAANATTSANNASSSSTAPLWVSGTTYAVNDKRVSPVTGQVYRRKVAGAGTTDPSLDSTNWYAVLLDADTQYPSIKPTLNLDFANSGKLDPRITFTRASTATYFDKLGVLRTASNNEPRFDYDPVTLEAKGLLIEETRQNLALWNRDLTNAVWVKTGCSVLKNQVGLDGTVEASTITATASNATILQTISSASNTRITSAYVKRVSGVGAIQMTQDNGATWTDIALTSSWKRFEVPSASLANPIIGFRIVSNADAIAVDFVQHELGPFSTSATATTSSAVTRQADNAIMTGTNFTSWYNQGGGTVYIEGDTSMPTSSFGCLFCISNGTTSNTIEANVGGANAYVQVKNSTVQADLNLGTFQTNKISKVAVNFSLNNFAACQDSMPIAVDTNGTLPAVDRIQLGAGGSIFGNPMLNGHIRKLSYYPRVSQNYQLQILTK
jgi:hypothetical protein